MKESKVVFIGPQIRKIIADSHFQDLLGGTERAAWMAFKSVIANCVGNCKYADCVNYVQKCIKVYRQLG
ncbi:MAG: hypothetical protein ACEY3L_06090, partial [Wolbachia sp.]